MMRNGAKACVGAAALIAVVVLYTVVSNYCCGYSGSGQMPPGLKEWLDPRTSEKLRLKAVQNAAKARSVVAQLSTRSKPPPGCPTDGGLLPDAGVLDTLDEEVVQVIYHDYLSNPEVLCNVKIRMGTMGDGGWEVCDDEYIKPRDNCLVYSFGIAYDFSFDDMTAQRYGCEVHSFDPSMNMADARRSQKVLFHSLGVSGSDGYIRFSWPVKTLASIRQMLGHKGKHIDVLKMDVEGSEWDTLTTALGDGSLTNVSQFLFETHIYGQSKDYLVKRLKILKRLRDQGFRIFYAHKNPACTLGSKTDTPLRTACHEVHMLHIPDCASTG